MPQVVLRDGHRLHVRVMGRGAPCLLVHGFASDSSSWLPFVAPLMHRYRFIMPDLRGFGGSRSVPLAVSCPLTTYAHDLSDVAQSFGLSRLPLVGISMGALSSVKCFELGLGSAFSRYMHIDQGLVIQNTADYQHGLLGPAQPGFFARMRKVVSAVGERAPLGYAALEPALRRELAGVFSQFATAAFTGNAAQQTVGTLTARPELLRFFLPEAGMATHLEIMRAYLENQYDLREAFRSITVPTTVLIGGASRMYPPAGQRSIGSYSQHASLLELPGVGHMLPLEAPRRFLRELATFLAAA
jgi:non-heme chloroperoxidase